MYAINNRTIPVMTVHDIMACPLQKHVDVGSRSFIGGGDIVGVIQLQFGKELPISLEVSRRESVIKLESHLLS